MTNNLTFPTFAIFERLLQFAGNRNKKGLLRPTLCSLLLSCTDLNVFKRIDWNQIFEKAKKDLASPSDDDLWTKLGPTTKSYKLL